MDKSHGALIRKARVEGMTCRRHSRPNIGFRMSKQTRTPTLEFFALLRLPATAFAHTRGGESLDHCHRPVHARLSHAEDLR